MCAIFGTIGKAKLELIKEISQKQIFRGPDEQNFFVSEDNFVSLGNNRLSVIDKKKGNQPMLSSDRRFVTVFNGCIYNFDEIKKFLEKKNINFYTNSDTEVVANSFQHFGIKSFNYFDGMWAIAIYDQLKKEIILSRDYVGQKPLYYSKNSEYFLFSSQVEGIFLDKEISPKVSKSNLKKYFAYSHIPAPFTLFENIYQLEPGENIIVNSKDLKITKKKYWDLKDGPDYNVFFDKIDSSNFRETFNKIVHQHSVADMNPAISLSGGVDSYIVMEYLSKIKKDFTSFTLGFSNKTFDEALHVKNIKKEFKKEIFYTDSDDMKSNFLELSKFISDPIGDSSILPTYIVHKNIKKYTNVSLGGDGGDEAFFGYITFDAFNIAIVIKKFIPKFIFNILNKIANLTKISYDYLPFSSRARRFFSSINLKNEHLLPSWMGCLKINDISNLFGEKINENDFYANSNNIFSSNSSLMKNSQLYHYYFYLPMILKKVDQASMFNSVESRSPFLSKKVINFSLDQSVHNLYKLFNKKYFMKKIFTKDVPKNIFKRKKHGFAFPKESLLRDKKLIEKLLDYNILTNKDFFNTKYKNFLEKREDCSQYIWNELILNLSLQNYYKIRSSLKA